MKVFEELVFLDVEASSTEDLFTSIVPEFENMGYVNDEYLEALLEREKVFPTGLPTVPYCVAIPHTDSKYVLKSGIGVVKPKETIRFKEMGSVDGEVDAKYVFFLIIENGSDHIESLQTLINFVMDDSNMKALDEAFTKEEIAKIINAKLA